MNCPGVCGRPDHVFELYDVRRRNTFPQRACGREYNAAAPTSCCELKPSFVAQPFLRYTEPRSYSAYEAATAASRPELCPMPPPCDGAKDDAANGDKGDAQGALDASYTAAAANSSARLGTVPATCGATGGAAGGCGLTLSCGSGCFGESCEPAAAFRRREYPVGVTQIPATSLPVLSQYEYENPAGMYHYDDAAHYQASFDQTHNNHLAEFAKFAYQTEQERARLQYGLMPPFPQPSGPPPPNVAPRYQQPRPRDADAAPPIPYFRTFLDLRHDCGCNKSACPGDDTGTTCPPALHVQPVPLPSIYARSGGYPCAGAGAGTPSVDLGYATSNGCGALTYNYECCTANGAGVAAGESCGASGGAGCAGSCSAA